MDTSLIKQTLAKDPILKKVINRITFPEWKSTKNVFHDLMSCVIEQQIHYRSKKKRFEKLLEKAGIKELSPQNFESFEELGLRDVKLNARKYETIAYLLDHFIGNDENWSAMSDEEVRKTLGSLQGIGPWSVDMILLYTLKRMDIFPVDDYHLKKVMTPLYEIDSNSGLKKQMNSIAEKWSPYRSAGTLYLLAWKEQMGIIR